MNRKLLFLLSALTIIAGCAQPERRILATWYVIADPLQVSADATQTQIEEAEANRKRTLYLGLLNAGETSITIEHLVLNEFLPRRTPNEYKPGANPLTPGMVQFIELGTLNDKWKCHLPASVEVIGKDGEGYEITLKAESINVMPTSIPDLWLKNCTIPPREPAIGSTKGER